MFKRLALAFFAGSPLMAHVVAIQARRDRRGSIRIEVGYQGAFDYGRSRQVYANLLAVLAGWHQGNPGQASTHFNMAAQKPWLHEVCHLFRSVSDESELNSGHF